MKEVVSMVGGFLVAVIAGTLSAIALLRGGSAATALIVGTIISYVVGGLWYHFSVRRSKSAVSKTTLPAEGEKISVGGAV